MSEAAVHTSIARIRSMVTAIPDPELPVVSIGDLGMIEDVRVDEGSIVVTVLPTFIGCPALDVITGVHHGSACRGGSPGHRRRELRGAVDDRAHHGVGSRGAAGRGHRPARRAQDVRCPFCASAQVVMDSAFGPTQCRSLFYCRDCRQPFEAMKPV